MIPALGQEAALARLTAGVEQSASGSLTPVQKLSVRLFFVEPLNSRWSTWGDLRLTSLPQTITSTPATLASDLPKLASALPVNQLVRSGEFLAGVSYRMSPASTYRASVQAIASVGAAVPLAATPPPLLTQARFWRQYYGGVRVQSTQRAHIVDVTLGQNEAITGGGLHGMVMRFDAFYALPLNRGNVTSGKVISLFATAILKTSPRSPASDTGSDSYRVGIEADLVQMLKALRIN
jgi:hypothetical protein